MNEKKPEIAFLVYAPEKKRRKNNSFDGNDNIGALVIKEILERSGHEVGFCEASTAHKYQVVLVSLTSTYDVYAFYKAVSWRETWQPGKRTFTVIAGGFGMQNPHTIREYVDYAVFGRAENFVSDLVGAIVGGGVYQHESVMNLPDIHKVKIAQAASLYCGDVFKEDFIGCPNKCKFCHYSWVRSRAGRGVYSSNFFGDSSKEFLLKDYKTITKKQGVFKTAIDGFSNRIRRIYGKKIDVEDIKNCIEYISNFDGTSFVRLYNVSNFHGETIEDKNEFIETINKISTNNRVLVQVHTSPLRPSLATPLQYSEVTLKPDHSKNRMNKLLWSERFMVSESTYQEGAFSHLSTVIAERATKETDKLFRTICFSKKLKSKNSDQKIKALQANFDLSPYLRRYDPDEEKHPGWWLESYMPKDALKKAFLWTEKQMEAA